MVAAEPVYTFAVVGRPAALLEPVLQVGPRQHRPRPDLRRPHPPGAPPEISKWSGVLAYCAEQGIDPARVLAVGDGANDLELLDGAAVACAVATATPDVLARADHVIGPRPAAAGPLSSTWSRPSGAR